MVAAESLADFLDRHLRERTQTLRTRGEMLPFFISVDSDGEEQEHDVVPLMNDRGKHLLTIAAPMLLNGERATRYVFACESWMVERGKDDPELMSPPSQSPNRIEVIWATAQERGQPYIVRVFNVERDATGTFTGLRENPRFGEQMAQMSGRMVNWFKVKIPNEAQL